MKQIKIVLFNPCSANAKHRIPNSILQVGSSIEGKFEYYFVDGNLEIDPLARLFKIIREKKINVVGMTVMPGPQLKQAIPFAKKIKEKHPEVKMVWGGYFASNQYRTVLNSGFVDFVISGPADEAFPKLLQRFNNQDSIELEAIPNLIYKEANQFIKTRKVALPDMDHLPNFPYERLDSKYALKNYLAKTFMGQTTLSYHSSFGCPFTCSFCAVVPIYNARWKGFKAEKVADDVLWFKEKYGVDAVEFHDNNFFTSRKRVVDFAEKMAGQNVSWWGEGRIDTINKYSDEDLVLMKKAGLKMIFLGAETGNDEVLKQMDKGGTQTGDQIREFAKRLGTIGIIPEYSFVLGLPMPNSDEQKVTQQINEDIDFIREIKQINPKTEIIIYLYSPVPSEGSELFKEIQALGFKFPQILEDWLSPSWENFDLRKNPLTPWLNKKHIDKIKNFETVLNAYYPTSTDFRIRGWKRTLLRIVSSWRYHLKIYAYPYEIKLLHKIWRYRQPEEQGFYSE